MITATPLSEQKHEATVLLKEFLSIFTDPELSSVVEHTISDWLSKRQSRIIIIGLLNAAGNSLETPEVYGSILELTLETYFSFVGSFLIFFFFFFEQS